MMTSQELRGLLSDPGVNLWKRLWKVSVWHIRESTHYPIFRHSARAALGQSKAVQSLHSKCASVHCGTPLQWYIQWDSALIYNTFPVSQIECCLLAKRKYFGKERSSTLLAVNKFA